MILCDRCLSVVLVGAIAAVLAAGPVSAQQQDNTVAKLKDVEGNVLFSSGDAMVAGANDQRLAAGTRVVTTTGAKVTISYDVGCDVHLKENERFRVTIGPCAALLAQVEALGPAAGAIGGGTAGTTVAAGAAGNISALAATGVITGIGIYELTRKTPISPH